MIPKIIHWIWLSDDPYPPVIQKCLDSWKILEDNGYIIKKWDRTNFDIDSHPFVRKMYDEKLYAFASDYIRLWVLYSYGGIYLDSDIEVLKPFTQEMLDKPYMFGMMDEHVIAGYIMGCKKGNGIMKELLEFYDRHVTEPRWIERNITPILTDNKVTPYPRYYFTPSNEDERKQAFVEHHFQTCYKDIFKEYKNKQIKEILGKL